MSGFTTLRAVDDGSDPSDTDPAPPHSIEAEQIVLGAVMLSPVALAEVRPLLDGSHFFRPAHQLIWSAITELADRGAPTDPLAVGNQIGARDLKKASGAPYLHTLITRVPTATNAAYYAHLLRDLAYARGVIATGSRLVQLGQQSAGDGAAELRTTVAAELAELTTPDTRGWAEPTPLTGAHDLPEFPIWCLPSWVGEYAACVAELTQTPPDLAGCLSLAVLAVAAGGNVWVRGPAWSEPTNLFVLVVLPPGNRKSEVYKAMTAPIREAERILIEQARPRIAEATIARRIAETDAERTEKAATEALDAVRQAEALAEAADARVRLDNAQVPAEPKLFGGNDSTVEKVTSRLAQQNGRFAVLAPEGGKLFSIAGGRYSGSPDMGVFLSGHAGEEIRIERIGRPSEQIDAATLTIGICLQPGVLARLGETPEFAEQGLLGRLLISMPESLLGYRKANPDPIPADVTAAYQRNLTALALSLRELSDRHRESAASGDGRHLSLVGEARSGEPPTLTFSPEAQQTVIRLLAETEPRFRPGSGDLAHMTDWGGKLVGAILRIAALLHLAEHSRDGWARPITQTTLDNAVQLGEYFTAHAQAAYDAIGADPAVNHARAILDWARHTGSPRFTARDLMRGLKNRFAKVSDTEPALRVLETHGWVRRLPAAPVNGRGRPAAPVYEVHPEAVEVTR